MAWDQSRPVAWQRLIREWLLYVGLMAVLFVILFRDNGLSGALAGLFISGPLYLAFGYAMAKLGYRRKSLKELRTPQAESRKQSRDTTPEPTRPAPTKRTSGGGNRPKSKPRRR
jgi:hypothetical protein